MSSFDEEYDSPGSDRLAEPAPELAREAVGWAAQPPVSAAILVLATIAVVAALYFARDLMIPLAFAALLALLLRPLLRRMQAIGVPDFAAAFILVGTVALVTAFGMVRLAG